MLTNLKNEMKILSSVMDMGKNIAVDAMFEKSFFLKQCKFRKKSGHS